jgi:hypothetical protein
MRKHWHIIEKRLRLYSLANVCIMLRIVCNFRSLQATLAKKALLLSATSGYSGLHTRTAESISVSALQYLEEQCSQFVLSVRIS